MMTQKKTKRPIIGNTSYLDPRPARYFGDIKSVEGDKIIILLTLFLLFGTPVGLGLGLGFMVLFLHG